MTTTKSREDPTLSVLSQDESMINEGRDRPKMVEERFELLEKVFGNCNFIKMSEILSPNEAFLGKKVERHKFKAIFSNGYEAIAKEISGAGVVKERSELYAMYPILVSIYDSKAKNKHEKCLLLIKRHMRMIGGEAEVHLTYSNGKEAEEIGFIDKKFSLFYNRFEIVDDEIRDTAFELVANKLSTVFSANWTNKDKKGSAGAIKEEFTSVQTYQIDFSPDATARQKALLFSVTFLIDLLLLSSDQTNPMLL